MNNEPLLKSLSGSLFNIGIFNPANEKDAIAWK